MAIQWFPGHMHKARLEMQATLPKVDVVIEVLDARLPYSSENPMLAELRGDKPCLKVLAKSDLADHEQTGVWLKHLAHRSDTNNIQAMAVTTEDVPTIRRIKSIVSTMSPPRSDQSIRTMVVGIPNVGKSTIINYLAGRKIAKTGNTPAVTKQQQRVDIGDGVSLLDTPGVMWPNVHNPKSGYRLALVGSIKDTAMDYADVGFFGARMLLELHPDRLVQRFELETVPTSDADAIEAIGRRRGCLGRNGVVDIDRASRILINEVRTGGLGRITLESPQMMEIERVQTEREIEAKAQRDREKDAKRKKRFRDKQRIKRKAKEHNRFKGQ